MRKHNHKVLPLGSVEHIIVPSKSVVDLVPSSSTTIPPSTVPKQWRDNKTEKTFSLSLESHITIFAKVELSRKRVSLLLEQEIVRILNEGFSIEDYFSFEWMMNYLIGSQSIHKVNGKKMSVVVYAANLILLQYKNDYQLLYQKTQIHKELKETLLGIFGKISDRKYQARKTVYDLEKFLLVKIESVNSLIDRSQNSVRYSSYCKGYGEGGRSARHQSTRYSYELDRDDSETEPEEFFSFDSSIHNQEDLFYLEQRIIREKKA